MPHMDIEERIKHIPFKKDTRLELLEKKRYSEMTLEEKIKHIPFKNS